MCRSRVLARVEFVSDEACRLSISSWENCTGLEEEKTCFAELALGEDWDAPMALEVEAYSVKRWYVVSGRFDGGVLSGGLWELLMVLYAV